MRMHPELLERVDLEELRLKQIAALVGTLKYAIETSDEWGDVRDLPIYPTRDGTTISKSKTIIGHKTKPRVKRTLAKPNPELMVREVQ